MGGIGNITGPVSIIGRRDIYAWTATGSRVRTVWDALHPWLCPTKLAATAQAAEVLVPLHVGLLEPAELVAWAAGFFDAEGCVSLVRHRSHEGYFYPEAAVTQSSASGQPAELLRFQLAVSGLGQIYGPYRQAGATKPVFRWRLHPPEQIRAVMALLRPRLGIMKCEQADAVFAVIDGQPSLPRGNPAWGRHKTHCIHGHEYRTARVRPYRSRGVGIPRRENKQCLVCSREQALAKRDAKRKADGFDTIGLSESAALYYWLDRHRLATPIGDPWQYCCAIRRQGVLGRDRRQGRASRMNSTATESRSVIGSGGG